MKKKIYSLAIASALLTGMLPMGAHAEATMGISSIKAEATGITVTFTENVDASTLADNILVIDETTGADMTDGEVKVTDSEVFVPVKPSVGTEVVLGIDNEIASVDANTLDKDYIQTYTLSGVYDDFNGEEGADSGWGASRWSNNNVQINIHDNMLKPVSESSLSGEQHMFYRDDYLSQKITGSQSVSFDYYPDAENGTNWENYFNAYLMADNISFTTSDTKLTASAYLMQLGYGGDGLKLFKQTDARNIGSGTYEGLAPLKQVSGAGIANGVNHKIRFTAEEVETGVELTVYVDGVERITYTDEEAPLSGGTSFFAAAKNKPTSVNKYYLDNVAFAEIKDVEKAEPTAFVNDVVSEINTIYEDISGTDYQEELDAISGKIKLIEKMDIAIDTSAKEKFNELNHFEISGAELDDGVLTLTFNKNLADMAFENYIKVYDGVNELEIACAKDNNVSSIIKINLPEETIGKELQLTVKEGITTASGSTVLSENYIASFTNIGYKDTFDGVESGWTVTGYAAQKGKPIDIYNGGIKPLVNVGKWDTDTGAEATEESTNIIEYSKDSTIIRKTNYTDYNFGNQSLEFDYQRELTTATDWGAQCQVYVDAYLMVGNTTYQSPNLQTDGYYVTIDEEGTKIAIGKRKASDGLFSMDSGYQRPLGTTLADKISIDFKDKTWYSVKFTAEKVSEGVKLTAYIKEDGVYVQKLTVTDTDNPFTSGTSMITMGRTNWSGRNAHIFDNIKYTGSSEITVTEFNSRIAEIKNRLTEIETTVADWNSDEIKAEVQGYINELTPFAGSTKVDSAIAQANKILKGKGEEEICQALSAEVIAKLKAKYENSEQIIVSGIGGSLTQGGGAIGIAVVKYIANAIGANITDDDIAIHHSTDLTNGEVIDESKQFVYLNAGNGGQGSDWHSVRLYSDLIQYNPDVVLIDYAGNDDNIGSRLSDGEHQTKTYTETTIRRLLSLENAPQVMMLYIPTEQHIAQALYKKAGILGTYDGLDTYTIGKFDESAYVYQREIAKHYGIAQLDLIKIFADNATLDYEAEPVESVTAYYKVSNGNVAAEATDDGASKVIAKEQKHIPVIDWKAIAEAYELDLDNYAPNSLDKIRSDYSNSYTFGMTDDELLNSFQRLGADRTHSTQAGYQFYADIISKLLTSDKNAAMRTVNNIASPIKVPAYDDINLERMSVTKELIDSSDRFTVTGSYENATFMSNRGVERNGVKFTGPATIDIKFTGNSIYVESIGELKATENGATQTQTYGNGLDNATIDDVEYNFAYGNDGNHLNAYMLTNEEEHTLSITVDDGKTLYLAGLYLDEDADWDNSTLAKDKYVTVDITKAANIYGATKAADGKVFSNYFWKWKDGTADESAAYLEQSLQDKQTYKPTILVNYEEDYYQRFSPDADAMKAYFDNEYDGSIPYDLSVLDNTRYRAIAPDNGMNAAKYWTTKEYATTLDVTDDYYKSINILATSRNDMTSVLTFNYEDGTTATADLELKKSWNADTAPEKSVFVSNMRNHFDTTVVSTYPAHVYEYTVAVPVTDKRVKNITIGQANSSSMTAYIYAITMEKVYDAGIFDVDFKAANGEPVFDLSKHAGEAVTAELSFGSNLTAGVNGDIYLSVYDAQGKLTEVIKTAAISGNTYVNKTVKEFTVPQSFGEGYTVKAMLWNGELTPLTLEFDF